MTEAEATFLVTTWNVVGNDWSKAAKLFANAFKTKPPNRRDVDNKVTAWQKHLKRHSDDTLAQLNLHFGTAVDAAQMAEFARKAGVSALADALLAEGVQPQPTADAVIELDTPRSGCGDDWDQLSELSTSLGSPGVERSVAIPPTLIADQTARVLHIEAKDGQKQAGSRKEMLPKAAPPKCGKGSGNISTTSLTTATTTSLSTTSSVDIAQNGEIASHRLIVLQKQFRWRVALPTAARSLVVMQSTWCRNSKACCNERRLWMPRLVRQGHIVANKVMG